MRTFVCLTLLILLAPVRGTTTEIPSFGLLSTGVFHSEEVSAKDGERWLGVYSSHSGEPAEVVEGTVRISPVFDAVTDKEGQKTGKKVEFLPAVARAPGEPMFLVKGPGVKVGKVGAFTGGEGKILTPGIEVEISQVPPSGRSARFVVYATGVAESGDAGMAVQISDYCMNVLFAPSSQIQQSERRQRLFCESIKEPGFGAAIRWIGDLNGDGVPDPLFSVLQYNAETLRLFLSGQRPQEIVSEAGVFRTTGC
jgi:hypothetical protein